MFKQVAILAPGLLGASLGQACAARGLAARIVVWARRAEARAEIAAQAWCDEAHADPGDAVAGADLVVLCLPVAHILPALEAIAPCLAPGTLVTDVGSTKGHICRGAGPRIPPGVEFIGSHPMAGSEKSGQAHATAGLFEDRPCFLTPTEHNTAAAVDRLEGFWQAVGLRTARTTPEAHDTIVAHLSHLPHVLATTLALTLTAEPAAWDRFAGPGLRDTSRIAAGSPVLWREICAENREALLAAIGHYRARLDQFEAALEAADFDAVEALLAEGKRYRDRLDEDPPMAPSSLP